MSKIEVNAIEPQCGTTLTIGASDTSIAGIGTVNWDTTAKTTSFTAVSGRGYFVNTTSGAITVTLPASPSSGDIVAVADYAKTASTNNITIARNSSNIEGEASDFTLNTTGSSISFVYVDATKGWITINSGNSNQADASKYVTATGGTETTCGDYKIHTFTGPGTFCVSCAGNSIGSNTVDYMVVAGGGGGPAGAFGGGGAGGYRESSGAASGCYTVSPLGACVSALPVSVTAYPITVGAGGSIGSPPGDTTVAPNGSNSIFSTITSAGGGGGGPYNQTANSGGSGGGTGDAPRGGVVGSGNTPPVSPPQGNPGGQGNSDQASWTSGGGGGGATSAGVAVPPSKAAGPGGTGATSSINGTPTARASGGGGGAGGPGATGSGPVAGGGGWFVYTAPTGATCAPFRCATANTGGGGGAAGAGGSGIVIIRYKYQ